MDPKACYERFKLMVNNKQPDEAVAALSDLCLWLARGGFFPKEINKIEFENLCNVLVGMVPSDACDTGSWVE